MKHLIPFLLLIILLSGFVQYRQAVYVSFKNDSKEDFKSLKVNIVGREFRFNNIRSGSRTKPIKVEKTYRYCFAEAITSKDTILCQPTDFVGEKLITSGKITMNLFILPEEGKDRALAIKF